MHQSGHHQESTGEFASISQSILVYAPIGQSSRIDTRSPLYPALSLSRSHRTQGNPVPVLVPLPHRTRQLSLPLVVLGSICHPPPRPGHRIPASSSQGASISTPQAWALSFPHPTRASPRLAVPQPARRDLPHRPLGYLPLSQCPYRYLGYRGRGTGLIDTLVADELWFAGVPGRCVSVSVGKTGRKTSCRLVPRAVDSRPRSRAARGLECFRARVLLRMKRGRLSDAGAVRAWLCSFGIVAGSACVWFCAGRRGEERKGVQAGDTCMHARAHAWSLPM